MTSDNERRAAAARLRQFLSEPWNERSWYQDSLQNVGSLVGTSVGENILVRLADLIDRPTCHDVTDLDRESFKCSRCGYRVLSIDGAPDAAKLVSPKGGVVDFGYCPNCGAEVQE